jgi:hypothetical protein
MSAGGESDAFGWGFAIALAIGSGIGYWLWSRAKAKEREVLMRDGIFADAEVTHVSWKGSGDENGRFISYRFTPAGSTKPVEFTETMGALDPGPEIGSRIRIVYRPGEPIVAQALLDNARAP